MRGTRPSGARLSLALAAFALTVAGVLAATDGSRFPGMLPEVAIAPSAAVDCLVSGPYRPPDPGSVGVPSGLTMCLSGPLTITDADTVVDGWEITGGIVVDAPNVTVRRSRIVGDGRTPYGIHTTAAGSVRVEDTTLTGDFPQAAIGDDRWTGTRIEITGVTHDGARLGDHVRLRNSRVHGFAIAPGVEADGLVVQAVGGDVVVEDNRVDPGPAAASAVRLASPGHATGADGPMVIRGNQLAGGRYTLYEDPAAGAPADVVITGNRFDRTAGAIPMRVSSRAALANNTFVDGGQLPAR